MSQVDALLPLVGSHVGIIRHLGRVSRGEDEPVPPILYGARLAHFDFRKGSDLERASAGKGMTDEEAMGGAIGEAVERYCASHYGVQDLRRAKASEVGAAALMPQECVLYSAGQYASPNFPYRPYADAEIDWVQGIEVSSGGTIWLPAALVYVDVPGTRPEEVLCPSTSNGLAAGPDVSVALLAAICELVERDAFLVSWMGRLPGTRIVVDTPGTAADIIAHYARFGVEVRLFRLPSDQPACVVLALALDYGAGPAAVIGLGCHLDPSRAVLKAVYEITQVRPAFVRRLASGISSFPKARENVRSLEDHAAFFCLRENLPELDFLIRSPARVSLSVMSNLSSRDAAQDVDRCAAALKAAGCRLCYLDLTTPDLEGFPIRVVRAIAAGLQPIHFGHAMARLGGARIRKLPHELGFVPQVLEESELNPCPHPLA